MARRTAAWLAGVLVGACLAAAAAAAEPQALPFGGLTRTYAVYRPARLEPAPALVVSLHGGFGTGAFDERAYGWDRLADRDGFVVAYPDGIGRAWNAGGCCGRPAREGVDDVGFLTALIDHLVAQQRLDPDRVYVTGMSNGAAMAYRLACEAPGRLAAIGVVAGSLAADCAHPRPVSVLAIHGLADRNVPFAGGVGAKGVTRFAWASVPDVLALWRRVDGCGAAQPQADGAVTITAAACAEGRAVTLITIAGAGHQWPGSVPRPAAALLDPDPPSPLLDATATLWAFFRTHRR